MVLVVPVMLALVLGLMPVPMHAYITSTSYFSARPYVAPASLPTTRVLRGVFGQSVRFGASSLHGEGVLPHLVAGGLRGDLGLLEAPAASLPRLAPLAARSARLAAAMDIGKKDMILPERAALAGLPASVSGGARGWSGESCRSPQSHGAPRRRARRVAFLARRASVWCLPFLCEERVLLLSMKKVSHHPWWRAGFAA